MAETNLITSGDLGRPALLDLVNRFGDDIDKFTQQILGVTRNIDVGGDKLIQMYKWSVTKAATQAGEGEVIPLTHMTRKPYLEKRVPLTKERKAVTAEAIRLNGIERAVYDTDRQLLNLFYKVFVGNFFSHLATAPTKNEESTLRMALSMGSTIAKSKFDEGSLETVAFVNPMDVAREVGSVGVNYTSSTNSGFQLITDFVGSGKVITHNNVPEGTVYSTVVDNLIHAHENFRTSDTGRAFNLVCDQNGFIGLYRSEPKTENAVIDTTGFMAALLFPEVADGVVETKIVAPEPEEPEELPVPLPVEPEDGGE